MNICIHCVTSFILRAQSVFNEIHMHQHNVHVHCTYTCDMHKEALNNAIACCIRAWALAHACAKAVPTTIATTEVALSSEVALAAAAAWEGTLSFSSSFCRCLFPSCYCALPCSFLPLSLTLSAPDHGDAFPVLLLPFHFHNIPCLLVSALAHLAHSLHLHKFVAPTYFCAILLAAALPRRAMLLLLHVAIRYSPPKTKWALRLRRDGAKGHRTRRKGERAGTGIRTGMRIRAAQEAEGKRESRGTGRGRGGEGWQAGWKAGRKA